MDDYRETQDSEDAGRRVRVMTEEDLKKENDFYYALGTRMAQARVGARKKQSEMGYEIFVTDNTMSAFERGVSKPRAYTIRLFCEATGTEPNVLLGYKGRGETETDLHIMAKVRGMSEAEKEKLLDILEILFPRAGKKHPNE